MRLLEAQEKVLGMPSDHDTRALLKRLLSYENVIDDGDIHMLLSRPGDLDAKSENSH